MTSPSFSSTSKTLLNLFAGEFPRAMLTVTIESGQDLSAGAVLGKITASGKFVLSLAAASDGSETPIAILAEDCDASAADVEATAYFSGDFAQAALTLGTGHTVASIMWGLVARQVYLRETTEV